MELTEEQQADLGILGLANDKGKFAIVVGVPDDMSVQAAIERCQENSYFTLIDVSPLAACPGPLFRVFKLTPEGWAYLAKLRGLKPN